MKRKWKDNIEMDIRIIVWMRNTLMWLSIMSSSGLGLRINGVVELPVTADSVSY
jgi:hypothetical protein